MARRVLAALVLCFAATFASSAGAVSFTAIYAFGDSLTDTGNACGGGCPGYPVPPYAAGRFSNGPVWVEGVAAGLGLSVSPSFYGGNDYAVGGATSTGIRNTQVPGYLSSVGGVASPTALYVLWGGGNDGLGGGSPVAAANNMIASINNLHLAGAQYFFVANLPDLSLTPSAYGYAPAQAFSLAFNSTFATGLAGLSGVTIYAYDAYAALNSTVANPGLYGYTNVNTPCWNGVTACANPNEYVFWDTVHPTATAHAATATAALALIPEPGTAGLVLVGLLIGPLVLASRRARLR